MKVTRVALVVSSMAMAASSHATPPTANASVEFKLTGKKPGKPPLSTFLFDVTLRNDAGDARWFLLPYAVDDGPKDGGVIGVERRTLPGSAKATVGTFLGTGAKQAVRVAGHATVTVRAFPVKVWEDKPATDPLPLDVVIAPSVTVGGEPISKWMSEAPAATGDADFASATRAGSRMTPDRSEVALVISGETRMTVPVPLH